MSYLATVTIAILVKDKGHLLNHYLECIETQTWPKDRTHLYIRTNDNTDQSAEILKNWIERVGDMYLDIFYDDSSIDQKVKNYGQHEWNVHRFKVLGKIRQDSLEWARERNSHYFVADCDNFITPITIESLLNLNLPIVGPMLPRAKNKSLYSNYHYLIDKNGYFKEDPIYYKLLRREIKGIIEVGVIHCTYLINREYVDQLTYIDDTNRYEYVIFSHSARKKQIPQYLDNRLNYGVLTFAETIDEFKNEFP